MTAYKLFALLSKDKCSEARLLRGYRGAHDPTNCFQSIGNKLAQLFRLALMLALDRVCDLGTGSAECRSGFALRPVLVVLPNYHAKQVSREPHVYALRLDDKASFFAEPTDKHAKLQDDVIANGLLLLPTNHDDIIGSKNKDAEIGPLKIAVQFVNYGVSYLKGILGLKCNLRAF
jgi:hypothetical protein